MARSEELGTAQDRPVVPNYQWDIGDRPVVVKNNPPAFETFGNCTTTVGDPVSIRVIQMTNL